MSPSLSSLQSPAGMFSPPHPFLPPRGNPPYSARGTFRRGLKTLAGFLIQLSPQACKHSGNSFVQPLHRFASSAISQSLKEHPKCWISRTETRAFCPSLRVSLT